MPNRYDVFAIKEGDLPFTHLTFPDLSAESIADRIIENETDSIEMQMMPSINIDINGKQTDGPDIPRYIHYKEIVKISGKGQVTSSWHCKSKKYLG